MKINFIGTGSGVISSNRFFTSFLIDSNGYRLLVEAGDGIAGILLKNGIDINQINGLIISHLHQDHAGGFAGLIVQMKLRQRKMPFKVFVRNPIKSILEFNLMNSYIFQERLGFQLEILGFEEEEKILISDCLSVKSKENTHLLRYQRWKAEETINFSSSSFLFTEGRINLFYTGDIGDAKDLLLFKDDPVTYIITETTHITIEQLIELIEKNYEVKKIYLTHFSDELEENILTRCKTFNKDLKKKIIITTDGMRLELKS